MPDIAEWIKANVKEGVNVDEGLQLVRDLDPLKNIDSREAAIDFMKRNDKFKSALDYEVQQAVETNSKKFSETKLPELIKAERQKIMQELNPEETPEQKRVRELEEKIAERDARDARRELEASLRTKAQELGFDPLRAERYAALGEGAMDALAQDVEWFNATMKAKLDEAVKGRYKTDTPPGGGDPKGRTMTRAEFEQLGAAERMSVMRGGEVTLVDDPV